MITAVLIAATLPFVVSILIALNPAMRAKSVDEYFLYERHLDTDGFVKTTIGYSLQVAAIALFFYWTFSFGMVGPTLVCVAWGGGFFIIARAVQSGKMSAFLGSGRGDAAQSTPTIHGYIGKAVQSSDQSISRPITVAIVALASIIGLGGTMMAEIDWGIIYLTQGLGLEGVRPTVNLSLATAILGFTVLYVLWGGYRAAVATDRIQVPFAYVGFGTFTIAVGILVSNPGAANGVAYALILFGIVLLILLVMRLRTIRQYMKADEERIIVQSRLSAIFTFGPMLILTLLAVGYLSNAQAWNLQAFLGAAGPSDPAQAGLWGFVGFEFWGLLSLLIVNAIWQLIDISSLQRLQSLERKVPTAKLLRVTGIEAALGWFLIIISAVVLRSVGLSSDNFLADLAINPLTYWLVPLFIFTVFVYMLSTISGFISALSYISFYDIVPVMAGRRLPKVRGTVAISEVDDVRHPRLTTVIVIIVMVGFYGTLRVLLPSEKIASVLYAIYAFQIVILPSVVSAIFIRRLTWPSAVIASVLVGILTAYATAVPPYNTMIADWLNVKNTTTWQVVPPLITAVTSGVVFVLVSVFWLALGASSGGRDRG